MGRHVPRCVHLTPFPIQHPAPPLASSLPAHKGTLRISTVWDHTFGENVLNVDPSETRILLTEPPLNPLANRKRLLETMFERYGFEGAFVQIQAVLVLYAQGACDCSLIRGL